MKLTIRQIVTTGPATIEREIYLEESNPLHQVQVASLQPMEDPVPSNFCPLNDPGTIQNTDLLISFPLLEMLISKVFEGE